MVRRGCGARGGLGIEGSSGIGSGRDVRRSVVGWNISEGDLLVRVKVGCGLSRVSVGCSASLVLGALLVLGGRSIDVSGWLTTTGSLDGSG